MYRVREQKTYRTWNELNQSEKDRLRWQSSIANAIGEEMRFAIEDMFTYELHEAVLPTGLNTHWRLSHSQGDGCSVTGTIPITLELLDRLTRRGDFPAIRRQLEKGGCFLTYGIGSTSMHYVHVQTMYVELEDTDLEDIPDDDLEKLGENLLYYLRDVCSQVEHKGYQIISDMESDRYISEMCAGNSVLFDEYGREFWGLEQELETDTSRFTDLELVAA